MPFNDILLKKQFILQIELYNCSAQIEASSGNSLYIYMRHICYSSVYILKIFFCVFLASISCIFTS